MLVGSPSTARTQASRVLPASNCLRVSGPMQIPLWGGGAERQAAGEAQARPIRPAPRAERRRASMPNPEARPGPMECGLRPARRDLRDLLARTGVAAAARHAAPLR